MTTGSAYLRPLALLIGLSVAACAPTPNGSVLTEDAPTSNGVVVLVPEAGPVEEPRRGLFAFLRKPTPDPAPSSETLLAEALIEDGAEPVVANGPDALGPSLTDEEIAARSEPASAEETRPRLFGFLRKRVPGEVNAAPTPTEVMLSEQGESPEPASMTDEEIAARSLPEDAGGGSTRPRFLGFLSPRSPGVPGDTGDSSGLGSDATVGGFGLLMRACGTSPADLGTEVGRSPGAGTYRLYDTKPNSAEPRMQYVTGFKDGCPRQVFAALALFGSPVVHETKRYDPTNKRDYSLADNAYERVKGRTCGVSRGQYCPEGRLNRLGRDVALLTAYPSFGGATEWLDVVLYKGEVAGQAVEE